MAERWRRCSACKSDIELGAVHWVCSVSTCNRKRTALVFCSVDCWEVHLPTERHREAWAVEARAPATADPTPPARSSGGDSAPRVPRATPTRRRPAIVAREGAAAGEILVVASRLKAYVKNVSGFNTSDGVLPVLSDALREICDASIENARQAERKTVMARDVPAGSVHD